jgi:hypothetical protein
VKILKADSTRALHCKAALRFCLKPAIGRAGAVEVLRAPRVLDIRTGIVRTEYPCYAQEAEHKNDRTHEHPQDWRARGQG